MVCIGCWTPARGLCPRCAGSLVPGRPRAIGDRLVVRAAFEHRGLARRLVHDLKYRGLAGPTAVFAPAMVALLPETAAILVPVPRATVRRLRLGVDPARELAGAMSRLTGLPVVSHLAAPVWQPRHAGRARANRLPARYTRRGRVPPGAILVDDVVTTGVTLAAAAAALGAVVLGAVTATGAGV